MRKSKSVLCFDRWSLVGSWLSQEPGWTLGCPSKQERKQLKGSSYPRGEWYRRFASWRKEKSGAKEVVERRTEEEGQWQEGGGSKEGVKRNTTGHSCQVAWWKGTGASCPSLHTLHFGGQSWAILWISEHNWWFTNPNYTLPEWKPLWLTPQNH